MQISSTIESWPTFFSDYSKKSYYKTFNLHMQKNIPSKHLKSLSMKLLCGITKTFPTFSKIVGKSISSNARLNLKHTCFVF